MNTFEHRMIHRSHAYDAYVASAPRRTKVLAGALLAIQAIALSVPPAGAQRPVAQPTVPMTDVAPAWLHPYAPGVDVVHYDMTITMPLQGTEIQAVAALRVNRNPIIDTLRLDLVGMQVDSVWVNAVRRAVVRDSASLQIPLRASDGSPLHVRVAYHGSPSDGLIIREDTVAGWSAFGDNWPNRARYWIPSVDHPSDKATIDWTVMAPSSRAVIANGTRWATHQARANAPYVISRFRMEEPIPTYLMVVGVATMDETSLATSGCGLPGTARACVPQTVWTFPTETPLMPSGFAEAGRIVSTFSEWFAPFPYAQLSHVQSATRFGGMENATAIFYSDQAFRRNAVSMSLIAHETAHQWFGDAVTPRRWADLWLSEGFATYLAALYTQQSRGDSAFHRELRTMRETVWNAPVVAERPVVDSVGGAQPVTLLNANSYQKGGFVLHMLRREIGDAAFFGALRDYQQQFRHGTATTEDLRLVLEQRAGRSLSTFMDQWVHRPGFPEADVSWVWEAARGVLVLQVVQGTRFPPFDFPLTFAVTDQDGRDHRVTVSIAAVASQQVQVAVHGVRRIAALTVDPSGEMLARVRLHQAMARE